MKKINPTEKQNFTVCHELGNFILRYLGNCFTELRGKSDSVKEREASIFSATILMPAIVLLSKTFYRQDSFQLRGCESSFWYDGYVLHLRCKVSWAPVIGEPNSDFQA